MTDYVCVAMSVRVYVRACVCVHKHALRKMGQGYGREKGPHLISSSSPPASHLCLSKLDFILQKQSGMNNSFSSPSSCFFIPLSYFLASVFLSISFCLSQYYFLHFFSTPFFFLSSFSPSVCLFLILLLWTLFPPSSSVKVSGRFCPWLGERYSGRLVWSPPCMIQSCWMCSDTHCYALKY